MGNATDSFCSVSNVAPPPPAFYHPSSLTNPIPSSHNCNVNNTGAENVDVWWKSTRLTGSLREKSGAAAQIPVSVTMNPMYSKDELIVSLLVPYYPHFAPDEWSFAMRTCHWIKTIKLQRARLQLQHFDEGTIIPPIPILMSSSGLNILGETLLSCIKLSQKGGKFT